VTAKRPLQHAEGALRHNPAKPPFRFPPALAAWLTKALSGRSHGFASPPCSEFALGRARRVLSSHSMYIGGVGKTSRCPTETVATWSLRTKRIRQRRPADERHLQEHHCGVQLWNASVNRLKKSESPGDGPGHGAAAQRPGAKGGRRHSRRSSARPPPDNGARGEREGRCRKARAPSCGHGASPRVLRTPRCKTQEAV
jgi:hypothetical protein